MGKNEAWLVQLAIEGNKPLPRSVVEAPILDDITIPYYNAFQALSRARGFTSSGVPLPITMEAMDVYATRFEIDDFEEFLFVIAGADDAYLKGEERSRKAKKRRAEQKAKRDGRRSGT